MIIAGAAPSGRARQVSELMIMIIQLLVVLVLVLVLVLLLILQIITLILLNIITTIIKLGAEQSWMKLNKAGC